MHPCATGIGTLVNSVTVRCHHASHCVFAHAGKDDVVIAGSHGDRTHSAAFEKRAGNILPGDPGIGSLPDATARAAHAIGLWIANHSTDGNAAATAKRPDIAEFERGKLFRNRLRFGSRLGWRALLGRGEIKARGQTNHQSEVMDSIQGVISSCIMQ